MSDVANLIQISYYFFAIRRFIKHKKIMIFHGSGFKGLNCYIKEYSFLI